jgi:transcriptional regulator with XRE-family HTH domain
LTPFADLLKRYRKVRQLRQAEVALLADIEQSYLSAMENGHKSAPSAAVFDRLCKALDLRDEEILKLDTYRTLSAASINVPCTTTIEGRRLAFQLMSSIDMLSDEGIELLAMTLTVLENKNSKENEMKD